MAAKYPFAALADRYIADVLSGKIPVCKWVFLACKRHRDDMEKSRTSRWQFKYDREQAERACRFVSNLRHIKGKWARGREKITLEAWQCFIVCMIFGWVSKKTGLRRFRRAMLLVPRKNAKTTLAAAIGLYGFVADNEFGAEVYCGATSEKQALEVFSAARMMVTLDPDLKKTFGISVNARNLSVESTNSKFEPVIGIPGDGASPSIAIHDEVHEHVTDAQIATMETGQGARENPLQLLISTAGDNQAGPCYIIMKEYEQILLGVFEDDTVFFLNYSLDPEDDWSSLEAARKANPNYGISVMEDYLEGQRKKALYSPRSAAAYKTKNLNLWVNAAHAYFSIDDWNQAEDKDLKIEQFTGREAWVSLDLSSKIDLASMNVLIPMDEKESFVNFSFNFLPEETVEQPENQHYRIWRDENWLTVTDGEIIDFEAIQDKLRWIAGFLTIKAVAYDPFQATMLSTHLAKEGFPMLEYRQTVINFSDPMKQVEAWIKAKRIRHNGNPVLAFGVSNIEAKEDVKRNVYPRKPNDRRKIDPAIALLMSAGCWISRDANEEPPSVYATQNIICG